MSREKNIRVGIMAENKQARRAMQILLVEDSPGDVRLTREAFRDADPSLQLHTVPDGAEAMAFLRREGVHADAPRPEQGGNGKPRAG